MGRDEAVVTQKPGKPPSPPKVNSKCIFLAYWLQKLTKSKRKLLLSTMTPTHPLTFCFFILECNKKFHTKKCRGKTNNAWSVLK